jgi:neutral trehalase
MPAGVGTFDRVQYYWEKYDVITGDVGKSAVYPTQSGFGWTLRAFVAMVQEFLR